ncbi:MAG: hypothetical protein PUP92_39090 [Rhizonema sp. PD38]|nr:hypothetical protein [Rhizonema sp. PD38]
MVQRIICNIMCLGDVEGPRYLDGRIGDGTVGLAPDMLNFSGTKWAFNYKDPISDSDPYVGWLECLRDIDGLRILDGRTKDGTVGLTNDFLSGTSWQIPNNYLNSFATFKCLGDVDGPRYLDGRTIDGTVGLALTTEGFSGTKWHILVRFG